MLEVRNLFFSYNGHPVLRDLSLTMPRGRVTALLGPNGAGKTTLLRLVLGLLPASRGEILLDGRPLAGLGSMERARRMAYVPQDLTMRFPMTVFEAVLMGRRPYLGWRPSVGDMEIVERVVEALGLAELAERDLTRLSGGQRQKVALARALVQEADFLILDEPTSNLDLKHQIEVMEIASAAAEEHGLGVVMAIHDLNLASRYAGQVALLREGGLAALGSREEVLGQENIEQVYGLAVARYANAERDGDGCWFPVRSRENARRICQHMFTPKGDG